MDGRSEAPGGGRDLLGDDGASGRTPHVTPLVAVWLDDALLFSTGEHERKAKNLATNPHVVMTTGCNAFRDGFDLVVDGEARRVSDDDTLRRAAGAFASKYDWRFEVRDGAFHVLQRHPLALLDEASKSRALLERQAVGSIGLMSWK